MSVLKGMSEARDEGGNLNKMLDDLGVSELRQVDTLSRLVNAQEEYSKNIGLANTAYKESSALNDEAKKRYETVEAQLIMMKNALIEFAISMGDLMLPIIEKGIQIVNSFTEKLNNMSPATKRMIAMITGVVAALAPLLLGVAKISGFFSVFLGETIPTFLLENASVIMSVLEFASSIQGLLIPLALLIAGIVDLYNNNETFHNSVNGLISTMAGLFKATLELIITVFTDLWKIGKATVEVIVDMWHEIEKTIFAKVFIQILSDMIDWIKKVIEWVTKLIKWLQDAANWFMT